MATLALLHMLENVRPELEEIASTDIKLVAPSNCSKCSKKIAVKTPVGIFEGFFKVLTCLS